MTKICEGRDNGVDAILMLSAIRATTSPAGIIIDRPRHLDLVGLIDLTFKIGRFNIHFPLAIS